MVFSIDFAVWILTIRYLEAILRSDTTWFDLHDPAALPTMIATNVQTLGIALGSKFGRIFQAFGQFGAGIVMAFTANWQLACVTLGMMPLMAGAAFWLSCVMAKMNLNNQAWLKIFDTMLPNPTKSIYILKIIN